MVTCSGRSLQHDGDSHKAPHFLKGHGRRPAPGFFVVLMRRDCNQIHASALRIGWAELGGIRTELGKFGLTEGGPAAVKYGSGTLARSLSRTRSWSRSPRAHPMFVPEALRQHFGPADSAVTQDCRATRATAASTRPGWPRPGPGRGRVGFPTPCPRQMASRDRPCRSLSTPRHYEEPAPAWASSARGCSKPWGDGATSMSGRSH